MDVTVTRITATDACKKYKLYPEDLSRLPCIIKKNPHRRSTYMRLFIESDVEELSKVIIQERESYKLRQIQQKELAKQHAQEVYQHLKKTPLHQSVITPYGCASKLPTDVWANIVNLILSEYEPNGILGMHTILKRCLTLAQVCKDAYMAIKQTLPQHTPQQPSLPAAMNTLVHTPTQLTVPQIKEVLKHAHLPVSGTKAELIMRFFKSLKIEKPLPSYIPIHLYMRVLKEKETHPKEIISRQLYNAVTSIFSQHQHQSHADFQDVFSNTVKNSQEIINRYETYIKEGCEYIQSVIPDFNPLYLQTLTAQTVCKFGMHKETLYPELMKSYNLFIIGDKCIQCRSNIRSQTCDHACCGRCCHNTYQACRRHR